MLSAPEPVFVPFGFAVLGRAGVEQEVVEIHKAVKLTAAQRCIALANFCIVSIPARSVPKAGRAATLPLSPNHSAFIMPPWVGNRPSVWLCRNRDGALLDSAGLLAGRCWRGWRLQWRRVLAQGNPNRHRPDDRRARSRNGCGRRNRRFDWQRVQRSALRHLGCRPERMHVKECPAVRALLRWLAVAGSGSLGQHTPNAEQAVVRPGQVIPLPVTLGFGHEPV
jgi:hypothetical protein